MSTPLSTRDRLEVERSASEASKIVIKPVEVDRYLNPPANTAFPLEYAFHLLGDVRGKTVLDLGCGSGETLIPLVRRGAHVIGLDISPDLIEIARKRLEKAGLEATVRVGSAYETELPDASVDVLFCMSLIHHLDIARVREEMRRVLRPSGFVVLKEPVRFSKGYGFLRSLLPSHQDVSEYEHPLTRDEFRTIQEGFEVDGLRYFRLPFVPLVRRVLPGGQRKAYRLSDWMIRAFPKTTGYATTAAMRLRKAQA